MVVDISTDGEPGTPQPLFELARGSSPYGVTRDGSQILVQQLAATQGDGPAQPRARINVFLNWFEELAAPMPSGG